MASGGTFNVEVEEFPLRNSFSISRGSKTVATVLTACVTASGVKARGECVPYARYGETVDGARGSVANALAHIDFDRCIRDAQYAIDIASNLLCAGAARNAVEAVCVDLYCRASGATASAVYRVPEPEPIRTCATVSLASAEDMAAQARAFAAFRTLKLKLDGTLESTVERLETVRSARPDAELIVDANEAWLGPELSALCKAADAVGVTLIEQPCLANRDDDLASVSCSAVLCADESLHTTTDLEHIAALYGCINIKLDKTGGVREALALAAHARELGLKIMVGSMVSTSLSMAPAMLVAQGADWVDLDSPALLARDRDPALTLLGDQLQSQQTLPGAPRVWG